MAEDLNMTPLLPSLAATAQIRRVKPTDPENERRSPDEQTPKRKKSKHDEKPRRATAAVEVDIQAAATPATADSTAVTGQSQQQDEAKPGQTDKTIDIRV